MKLRFTLALSLFSLLIFAQKPKLVVTMVVDQMRYDYLKSFEKGFQNKGFSRLVNQGVSFDSLHYHYVPTFTAPGHASIFTGKPPKEHGIIGNNWFHRASNEKIYCVQDPDSLENGVSFMSARNLKSPTLAEMVAQELGGRTFSISLKDRGAIIPGGQSPTGTFWLNEAAQFISSGYYPLSRDVKEAVNTFNQQHRAQALLNGTWDFYLPRSYYPKEIQTPEWERSIFENGVVNFPYDLKKLKEEQPAKWIRYTPFGNTLLFEFSKWLVSSQALGQKEQTDFLSISLSATDYVGHRFGPESQEVADTYYRLSDEIEDWIQFLDKNVGRENYVLLLTSDHGAGNISERIEKGGNILPVDLVGKLKKALPAYPFTLVEGQLYIEWDHISEKDSAQVIHDFFNVLQAFPFISDVYAPHYHEWHKGTIQDMMRASVVKERMGDLTFHLKPNWVIGGYKGADHGTGYSYDTHVPGILFGGDLPNGKHYTQKTKITDLTPILLWYLQLPQFADFNEFSISEKTLNQLLK